MQAADDVVSFGASHRNNQATVDTTWTAQCRKSECPWPPCPILGKSPSLLRSIARAVMAVVPGRWVVGRVVGGGVHEISMRLMSVIGARSRPKSGRRRRFRG
jgi:hypothetical protein